MYARERRPEMHAHEMHELKRCGEIFFAVSEMLLPPFSSEIEGKERYSTLKYDGSQRNAMIVKMGA
jgi:hypothetical protein